MKKEHIIFILSLFSFVSCLHDNQVHKNLKEKVTDFNSRKIQGISFKNINGVKCIFLDSIMFKIPTDEDISFSNLFNGIYEIRSDSLTTHYYLFTNKFAYLTTFYDLGFGYKSKLYVFDLASRNVVIDTEFKHNYLFSEAGKFIIEPNTNEIFALGTPSWYDKIGKSILTASLYNINLGRFDFRKNVYTFNLDYSSNSSLLGFFRNSKKWNGFGVYVLPNDWWKSN